MLVIRLIYIYILVIALTHLSFMFIDIHYYRLRISFSAFISRYYTEQAAAAGTHAKYKGTLLLLWFNAHGTEE